jgi:uncharacterized membrane protein
MKTIEESIVVDVPIRTAYDQWTQFEEFPSFMEGVKEVRQLDDKRLAWRAEIMGKEVSWNAEITEQVPDTRISWRSTSGREQRGSISFTPRASAQTENPQTELKLRVEFEPEGAAETTGATLGLVTARVKGDLERFKKFIEQRGAPTGQWRGEIHGGEVRRTPEDRPSPFGR